MKITLQCWVQWEVATTFRDGISISWTIYTAWLTLLVLCSHWSEKSPGCHNDCESEWQKHLIMRIRQWPKQSFQTVKNFGTSDWSHDQCNALRVHGTKNTIPFCFFSDGETIIKVLFFIIKHGIRSSGDSLVLRRSEDLDALSACLKLRVSSLHRQKKELHHRLKCAETNLNISHHMKRI